MYLSIDLWRTIPTSCVHTRRLFSAWLNERIVVFDYLHGTRHSYVVFSPGRLLEGLTVEIIARDTSSLCPPFQLGRRFQCCAEKRALGTRQRHRRPNNSATRMDGISFLPRLFICWCFFLSVSLRGKKESNRASSSYCTTIRNQRRGGGGDGHVLSTWRIIYNRRLE